MRKDVTVVNLADLEMEDVRRGRVHMIRRKRLPLESGVPGVTLEFSYSIVPEGYFTPRHRHNFDQIRWKHRRALREQWWSHRSDDQPAGASPSALRSS